MSEVELTEALTSANSQLQSLQARVSELERKTSANVVLPSTDKFRLTSPNTQSS